MKFSTWPCYSENEAEAVKQVIQSNKVNYWTGKETKCFEEEFAHFTNSEYAIALSNGTVALDLALKALNIGPGDEVIVTPRSFIASVSCVVNAGATPIFADVDLNSQNIEAHTIKPKISPNTKAVIVVHLSGMPADMDPIMNLAKQHHFYVIEDCAQAHGARYKDRSVGSIGDIGTWSFCNDKIMTTGGEGGMITTDSEDLWSKMWAYKDHGKHWETVYEKEHPVGFRWLHQTFGTNWRMTEMQAAIGRIQLSKMTEWTKIRNNNAQALEEAITDFNFVRATKIKIYMTHAYYKYYFFVDEKMLNTGWNRDRIVNEINNRGVPCFHGSCPEIYLEAAFERTPWRPKENLLNAQRLGNESVMLTTHPSLTKENISKTYETIQQTLKKSIE